MANSLAPRPSSSHKVLRRRVPFGSLILRCNAPGNALLTVIKGTWWTGAGPMFDPGMTVPVRVGGFAIHTPKESTTTARKMKKWLCKSAASGQAEPSLSILTARTRNRQVQAGRVPCLGDMTVRFLRNAGLALIWAALVPYAHANIGPAPLEHSVWVFANPLDPSNPVSDPAARQTLIARAAASRVTSLYVSVYRSSNTQPTNTNSRRMYEDADIADLIARAHASTPSIKVFAAYGAPDWPSLGCAVTSFPMQRMQEVLDYNRAHASASFDGVILDIEPPVVPPSPQLPPPLTEADYLALLTQYKCLQQLVSPLPLGAAIRFGWKDLVTFNGSRKPFYQHAIDLFSSASPIVVMGYRDFAGTSAPASDGVIAADADQVSYALQYASRSVLAGLETSDPAAVGISNKETFYEEGQSVLNNVAQAASNQFGYRSGLGGFAIHNYGGFYLSGTSLKWPAVNPNFPQYAGITAVEELATPSGGPVTVTPTSPINGANVTVGFQSVADIPGSSWYTYVAALDAASLAPLPSNYLSLGGLTFDISTTAPFSGPVMVCFSNMDPGGADFTSLRVLHDTAGVVDETILSGAYAPNAATRTVCASVTSFSPFRIAQCVSKASEKKDKRAKKCGKLDQE